MADTLQAVNLSPSEEGRNGASLGTTAATSMFQASAPPKRGCPRSRDRHGADRLRFQSSAPPKRGCNGIDAMRSL